MNKLGIYLSLVLHGGILIILIYSLPQHYAIPYNKLGQQQYLINPTSLQVQRPNILNQPTDQKLRKSTPSQFLHSKYSNSKTEAKLNSRISNLPAKKAASTELVKSRLKPATPTPIATNPIQPTLDNYAESSYVINLSISDKRNLIQQILKQMPEPHFSATIDIIVDYSHGFSNGKIIAVQINRSSGNVELDNNLISIIESSSFSSFSYSDNIGLVLRPYRKFELEIN